MNNWTEPVSVYMHGCVYSGVLRSNGTIAYVVNGMTRFAAKGNVIWKYI